MRLSGIIPARSGVHVFLRGGQTLRIINRYGNQVIDTWAFVLTPAIDGKEPRNTKFHATFPVEYMSMCHSRAAINALRPTVGSTLVTNHRKPILKMVNDTSSGIHDTLCAACDIYRYRGLLPDMSEDDYHDNCSDNLQCALDAAALDKSQTARNITAITRLNHALQGWTPDPFNLFMNIPWNMTTKGDISFEPPTSKAGEFVELRAERHDVLVCMSACPQDVLSINGHNPVDGAFEVS